MLVAFLVGAIQLVISFLRLGDLTRYISHSVIVGFTAGASVLLVLDQMKNLLGLKAVGDVHDHFLVRFWRTHHRGRRRARPTTLPSALGVDRAGPRAALAEGAARLAPAAGVPDRRDRDGGRHRAARARGTGRRGGRRHPGRAAVVRAARARRARTCATSRSSALAIALLGLLEAISMAKAIAAVTGQKLDMNQQCLSEGVANFAGSFFQCMPGSGSLTRSAINQQAGAQTQWSGVVSAVAVALIMRGVRALRALHPALGAGRPADGDGGAHGEPARPALPRARRRASTP